MTTLDGTHARRYATYGRAAGIAILVCAGALWAVPLPGMKELPPKPVPPAPPQVAETASSATVAKVDADVVDATATRLDQAWVHVEKKAVAEEPKAKPPDEPAGPEWTYLGPIHEADRTLAIIAVDGHQKVLAEGRSFGDTKLVSVSKDGIDVEVKGTPKHIERGQRSGSTVAWVRNLQTNTPLARAGGVPGQLGMPGNAGNLPPEVRARLAERGITPEQMQNWRGRGGGGPGGFNGNQRNRGQPGGGGPGGGDMRQRGEVYQPMAVPLNVKPGTDAVPIDAAVRSVN